MFGVRGSGGAEQVIGSRGGGGCYCHTSVVFLAFFSMYMEG